MKNIKKVYKTICIIILVGIILCFKNSSITLISQASNTNLNKSINLNAKKVKAYCFSPFICYFYNFFQAKNRPITGRET